ncbi:MAG: hypothetical protein CSA65_09880 [Proteobacteria bacterium]|nr:MAG: hypothetical protein CSA65_09880 [Pseudomonadota bacterium]
MRPTSKGPCKLERGEMRRVSQDRRFGLVGYHVCCPRCGYVTVALNGRDEMVITEEPATGAVTFSVPQRCVFCQVLIHVRDGLGRLEEDEHVRDVRYR